jgi:FkbM family methyltransferase
MSWHAASRQPFSTLLYKFSRRYVMAWSNAEVDMQRNGERWLVETLTRRAPVPGGVFFDIGANEGEWSALVLANAPDARLIAFEPVPAVRATLAANLAGSSATILPYAMSDQSGIVEINYTPDNSHFSSIEAMEEDLKMDCVKIEVPRKTGGEVCAELGIDHIRFLKVDTEGHDLQVIQGFRDMITQDKIDVIQFEYNYMSIYSKTFLKDFFSELTPRMKIGRLLRNRLEYFEYSPPLDNFIQSNFVVVRADLADSELSFLARG